MSLMYMGWCMAGWDVCIIDGGWLCARKRKNLDYYSCVLCQTALEETLPHLFFTCPFSLQCWQLLGIAWDFTLSTSEMIIRASQLFGSTIFREISILECSCIWTHRNSIIFYGRSLSLVRWRQSFKDEFALILHRAKPSLKQELETWFCNTF
uniref:Reverse transcriptase zinc-binding domain-containing protein n=1 Tax=Setaria viridis TaxID=4556 RepID=A0A4U6VQG8_SETVI|nr:hypothetical protein SEVIR_2G147300v2 [Setaria viridis]